MKKKYLFTPGPTAVPPEVLLSMAEPIIHHRTSDYRKIFESVTNDLKTAYKTKNDVFTFSSSGTGAMEAAVSNFLSKGDKALAVNAGKFGERWGEICKAYGVDVKVMDVEWGDAVNPSDIEAELKNDPDIKAVYVTHCETSTGVETDIKEIGKVVGKTKAILVVDAVSSLGSLDLRTDEWGLDVVVTGSQKALMTPPGIAFISVSEKAWKMVESSDLPKYFFSIKACKKSIATFDNPYTPPITLIIGVGKALRMICEEGIDNVISRHERLAGAIKAGVEAMGLELFSKKPANSVTAIKVPEGVDGAKLVKRMKEHYGVTVAGGQAKLKGKIFRIACMGYADTFDVIAVLSAVEMALRDLGYDIEMGRGVRAAGEVLEGMDQTVAK